MQGKQDSSEVVRLVINSELWISSLSNKKYAWRCSLSAKQVEMFEIYEKELLEWNEKFNLTASANRRNSQYSIFRFAYGMQGFHTIEVWKMIDIGTGAGFPGLLPLRSRSLTFGLPWWNRWVKRQTSAATWCRY
jgi:hypothetical protein